MTSFGPYQVLDRLGAGATGTVYRAQAHDSGRVVAVKEIAAPLRADPAALDRLRHEARLLRGLSHPNIVAVHDFVEEPGRAFLVSEYVDGAPLTAVLGAHGQLGPESALAVLHGALTGLGFAHRLGVVHGDISLSNIMLTVDGTSKLIDFGVASPVGQARVAGTPAFISPEAVLGSPRTTASDVYSAAAVLWTLLAGRPPFPGSDVQTVLQAQLYQSPPRLEAHGPELADLLERALAKDPAFRPPDAEAFLAELERAAERQYGADWPTRASLTGLAATTSGAVLAAAAGGAAPAAPAVVASSLVGEATPISAVTSAPGVVGTPLSAGAAGTTAAGAPAVGAAPLAAPASAVSFATPVGTPVPPSPPGTVTPTAGPPPPAAPVASPTSPATPPTAPPAPAPGPTAPAGVPEIPVPREAFPTEGPPSTQPPGEPPGPPTHGGPAAGPLVEPVRGAHRGPWIVGGVVTVVIVIVVVLVVVLGGGSGKTPRTDAGASGSAGTSGAQSSQPAPEPAGPAVPNGAYTKHSVVTVEDPVWDPAATGEYTIAYTFSLDCADVPCAGSVTGPGGTPFPGSTTVEFDGTTVHFENSQVVDYDCLSTFGIPYLGFVTTQVDSVADYAVGEAADGERPPMSGVEVTTFHPVGTKGDCPLQPPGTSTRQVTFTPA